MSLQPSVPMVSSLAIRMVERTRLRRLIQTRGPDPLMTKTHAVLFCSTSLVPTSVSQTSLRKITRSSAVMEACQLGFLSAPGSCVSNLWYKMKPAACFTLSTMPSVRRQQPLVSSIRDRKTPAEWDACSPPCGELSMTSSVKLYRYC